MGTQANASAEAISLPRGGGAVQGIGETFIPDLHTGTGNFSVPLALPPGRNGFAPRLALTYSTGAGNGPFGLGWSLSVPALSRRTSKGVPRYRDADADPTRHDVFVLAGVEELVPVPGAPAGSQRYRPRTEGLFARIDRRAAQGDWVVEGKDGTLSRYGGVQPGDVGRAVVADPDDPARVFSWMLTEQWDPFGNRIRYEYLRDRGDEGGRRWDQLYLHRVLYGDYETGGETHFLVTVELEYADRPDPFSDRRPGFEARTRRRCRRIRVRTHADEERLARTYRLDYVDERADLAFFHPRNGVSLLSRVSVTGHDGPRLESLPPLELGYTRFEPEGRRFFPLQGRDLPARSLSQGGIELVDLFGSGLPDFLEMDGTARYWRNLGGGRFDHPREMADAPAGIRLGDPGVRLVDADGDGRADLLVTTGAQAGFYPLSFDGGWDRGSFRPYAAAPSFDLSDPEVRLVDLDGDGVTDAIRSGSTLECFFGDPAGGWAEARYVERSALREAAGVSFADERVRWADMTGDGLADLVILHGRRVDYWPSLGRGNWGERVEMRGAPELPPEYDPRRLLLGDVDGDGVADLVYVDHGSVTLWLNRSGNEWSEPVTIHGTPLVSDVDDVRLVDLLGSGITGVLWSSDVGPATDHLRFLDLAGSVKPYLLNEMDNHTGARTRVEYAPSTRFYLADLARPETRWKTTLPFPVHVVARSHSIDAVSGGKVTSEFAYRHGRWDGEEREFHGFARVDRRDTESFADYHAGGGEGPFVPVEERVFSPPVETRSWFHPGALPDGRGGWGEGDFSAEFFTENFPGGDATTLLPRPQWVDQLLAGLAPRDRRDALRALRGRVLRTELYGLDGTEREARPYTVTETLAGVREEDPPAAGDTRRRVFFPHVLAERTTEWERGSEPLTRIAFTDLYDTHGQPRSRISVAVPRGRDPRAAGEWAQPYLATHEVTGYAVPEADAPRRIFDRVAHATTWEVVGVRDGSVFTLRERVLLRDAAATRRLIGQTLAFYDGEAFTGLPLGRVGSTGAAVRTEALVLTPEVLAAAYEDGVPPWLADAPATADWSGYPEAFRAALPAGGGYVRRAAAEGSAVAGGWYAVTGSSEYDFQRDPDSARGLVRRRRDPLGRVTEIWYDRYKMFPRKVIDPAGLVSRAAYDYRVLRPRRAEDPNGNRTFVRYTPLGMVRAVAVMGKVGQAVGDTPTSASTRHRYDLWAFAERGRPVSVQTRRREHYETDLDVPPEERDRTLRSAEYTDGFGRLIQVRTEAPQVTFGDSRFGGEVLPLDPALSVGDAVGRPSSPSSPRVVVSGWKVHDNKGRVVEEYEPFFSRGWSYAAAREEQRGRRVRHYYDSRGELTRTVNPDGSEQRVVRGVPADPADPAGFDPTPWEAWTYDANDNGGRTHSGATAAWTARHANTPGSLVVDALGRAVIAIARNRGAGEGAPIEETRVRSVYDIRGNVTAVVDALGRVAQRTVYDLAGRPLRPASLHAGTQVSWMDAAGLPIGGRDGKGALSLRSHDLLGRPTRLWARDAKGEPITLREILEYGDGGTPAQDPVVREAARALNQLGRPVRHHDEAGLVVLGGYDFRGKALEKTRRVIGDAHLLKAIDDAAADEWRVRAFRVDWTPPAGKSLDEHAAEMLDARVYETSLRYDALGRVKRILSPADTAGERRELRPGYDHGGRLERVEMGGEAYVERVAYNAAGQRTLVAYGNGVMTRYAYHPRTFRLARLRTERFVTPEGAAYTYRPAPGAGEGHPLQELAYSYDLNGNLLSVVDRTPGCGIAANPEWTAYQASDPALAALLASGDALVRRFVYDPLGRLESATGRESAAAMAPRPWHDAPARGAGAGTHATPSQDNAAALSTPYRETYAYDPAGNLVTLRHETGGGAWVRRFGMGGMTPDAWAEAWAAHVGAEPWTPSPPNRLTHAGGGDPVASATHAYDACGNLLRQNGGCRFAWDHGNRLRLFLAQTAASGSAPGDDRWAEPSAAAHYLYDSAGQRVKKLVRTQGGAVETTVYVDGAFEHQAWSRPGGASGQCVLHHVMDGKRRIAVVRTGDRHPDDAGPSVQYHLGDHLGSSAVVMDGEGGWTNREEFTPFGETTFGSFARKRFRFTGKERDGESGLYYHGARYYAPWLCRWASPDPAGLVDGPNPYAYCSNTPLVRSDPTGLKGEGSSQGVGEGTWVHVEPPGGTDVLTFEMGETIEGSPLGEGGGGAMEGAPSGGSAGDAGTDADGVPDACTEPESAAPPAEPDAPSPAPAAPEADTGEAANKLWIPGTALSLMGSVAAQAGSNGGKTTSILWTGKNALAGALEMGQKTGGAFRSLEASMLGRISYAISNPVLKVTNKAEWAKNALYHALWKPVSGIYGFHAGIAGHKLLKLVQTDLPIDPKYGLGSVLRNIESPAYKIGQKLIGAAKGLGRALPVVGGLLSAAGLAHSVAKGDVASGVGNALGVAAGGAAILGAGSAAAVLGAGALGYTIGTWIYEGLGGANGAVNVAIQDFFLWVGGYD